MMNKQSGSMLLWITVAVMLGCFLLIVCAIYATHRQTAGNQSRPAVYRQSVPAVSKTAVRAVTASAKAEEAPVRGAEEAGLE